MKSGIYKIQSKKNKNRFYIGSSSVLNNRKRRHFMDLKHNHHHCIKLQRHCNKHGIGDLFFDIVEYCNEEILISREQYYMDIFKPYFNSCPTAGSTRGRKMSEEGKRKVSLFFKGRPVTEETRKKLSEANKGRIQKPVSAETRIKLSKSLKGRIFTPEQRLKISIAKKLKMTDEVRLKISNSSKGKILSETTKQKIRDKRKNQIITYFKPVKDNDNNILYKSVKDAAKANNVTSTTIQNWCDKRHNSKIKNWEWIK